MPNDQNEQNLQNELYERAEERQEREEQKEAEPEQEEHEPEQAERESVHAEHPPEHVEPPHPIDMQQGAAAGQAQWRDDIETFRVQQAQEARMRSEPMRRDLAAKARTEQQKEEARKQKRRQRDQQYDRQIERGGPGAIWAALKKAFSQLVGDVVSDAVGGLWTGVKLGAGLAKDAVVDHYRTRGEETAYNELVDERTAMQPEQTVEQTQPQAEQAVQPEQPVEQAQPQAEQTVHPEQTVEQAQPQAEQAMQPEQTVEQAQPQAEQAVQSEQTIEQAQPQAEQAVHPEQTIEQTQPQAEQAVHPEQPVEQAQPQAEQAVHPEQPVEQAQPQAEQAVHPEQPIEQAQPQAEQAVQPEQTVEQPQPQAMPHPAQQERSFAERRDSIGREMNGLDNMCRAAAIITGEQPSRRDLAVALACMHDPKISGMSAGQSRFESEKIMRFLSGEQLSPQDGPINQDLLKKGLNSARQPGALERKGFLGALHDLSRVITRAPSLDAPHRTAAGEALDEIAKECTKAAKPELRIVGMRNTAISGNINANESIRKITEIRSAMTCSDIYRRGKQAQYDELDRICQMQERGMNIQNRIISPENAKAIAESEALNRNLAEQMVRERIALNQQRDVSRRVNDIAKMPMPNPMTMEVSGFVRNLGRDPRHMETVWQNGLRNLESVQGIQKQSAVSILDDMEKNRGGLAERMREDSAKLRSERTYRKEQEKRREQEKQKTTENSREQPRTAAVIRRREHNAI